MATHQVETITHHKNLSKITHVNFYKILILAVAVLVIAAAAWPLLGPGFLPTHDGEYHIIRFWQFEKVLRSGVLIPRWAPDLNSGYGIPVFIFNYPLPNYFGVLFHTWGASYPDALKLTLATGYLSAALFCFLWLKRLFGGRAAAVGAIVFAYIPYWFVELYVRGSVGEVLAIAFLLLALTAVESGRANMLAIGTGGIILSHNILAIAFIPLLVGYIWVRDKKVLWNKLLVGIGIASYFWLPAIFERRYVVGLNPVDFRDYFPTLDRLLIPSWGTSFASSSFSGNEMSLQIGLIPLGVILVAAALAGREKEAKIRALVMVFLFLVLGAFFLMLRISQPFWEAIPILPFWQYPWRWLAIFLPSVGFLAAFVTKQLPFKGQTFKGWVLGALALFAVVASFSYSRPVVYPPRDDTYYLSRPNFTDGTSSLGNVFTTRWTSAKTERSQKKVEVREGEATILRLTEGVLSVDFALEAKTATRIRVNTLYYPGWQVLINGQLTQNDYERDGTITFSVAPGNYDIRVSFRETPLRMIANGFSLFSLFAVGASDILRRNHAYRG